MTNPFDESRDAEQIVNVIEEGERGDGRSAESIPEGEVNDLPELLPAEPGQVARSAEEPTSDADETAAGPAEEREADADDDDNPVSTAAVE